MRRIRIVKPYQGRREWRYANSILRLLIYLHRPPFRYLSDYSDDVLGTFFAQVDAWETKLTHDAFDTTGTRSPMDPVVYHILSNRVLLENDQFVEAASQHIFRFPQDASPPIPVGVLSMLADSRTELRQCASRIFKQFRPLDETSFAAVYFVSSLFRRVESSNSSNSLQLHGLGDTVLQTPKLWDYLPYVLSAFTPTAMRAHFTGKLPIINVRRIVISNLTGTSSKPSYGLPPLTPIQPIFQISPVYSAALSSY